MLGISQLDDDSIRRAARFPEIDCAAVPYNTLNQPITATVAVFMDSLWCFAFSRCRSKHNNTVMR